LFSLLLRAGTQTPTAGGGSGVHAHSISILETAAAASLSSSCRFSISDLLMREGGNATFVPNHKTRLLTSAHRFLLVSRTRARSFKSNNNVVVAVVIIIIINIT